jgi:hypothetical protein
LLNLRTSPGLSGQKRWAWLGEQSLPEPPTIKNF